MQVRKLLPIGTVVLLEDGEKRLMIIGVKQTDNDGAGQEYDYIGVFYPEGYMGDRFLYLFNHEDIKTTYYTGFDDAERGRFIDRLEQVIEGE